MGDSMDFRGIRLVEVLWKATTGIIIWRLTKVIQYHDSRYVFHMGRGTGNTTLQDKLIHNVYHDGGSPSHHFHGPPEVVLDPVLGPVPQHPV